MHGVTLLRGLTNVTKYLKLLWLLPATAFLAPVLMMILMVAGPRGLGDMATHLYVRLFWITPGVGVVVLFILFVLGIVHRSLLNQINLVRTLILAILDVIAPAVYILLQVVLAGFLR